MKVLKMTDLEISTFQKRPAYRYIRQSDNVPNLETEEPNPIARIKLFDPTGGWTWYVSNYDPASRIAYGLVDGFELEYGNFSMEELVEFRGRWGLPIERDLHWHPRPLKGVGYERHSERRVCYHASALHDPTTKELT